MPFLQKSLLRLLKKQMLLQAEASYTAQSLTELQNIFSGGLMARHGRNVI